MITTLVKEYLFVCLCGRGIGSPPFPCQKMLTFNSQSNKYRVPGTRFEKKISKNPLICSKLNTKMLSLKKVNTEKTQCLLYLQEEMLEMLTLPSTIGVGKI